jgi:hypothetical protein
MATTMTPTTTLTGRRKTMVEEMTRLRSDLILVLIIDRRNPVGTKALGLVIRV